MNALPVKADRDALFSQIAIHFKSGTLLKAQQCLDTVLAGDPWDVPALMLRAMVQVRLKLWEGAQADFSKARSLDPSDREAWLGEAVCLASRSDVYPALDLLERMLEAHPKFVRGHLQAARLYFKLVVLPKGQAHMKAALAADPTTEERREIEALLKEEAALDQKRYHRPDFEALRRQKAAQAQS